MFPIYISGMYIPLQDKDIDGDKAKTNLRELILERVECKQGSKVGCF